MAQRNDNVEAECREMNAASCDHALAIAHAHAVKTYRDLTPCRIEVVFEADGWHVDYNLKAKHAGGGPHYTIDQMTGVIL